MEKCILYCIPNAGASSVMYLKWRKYLSEHIALQPLEISGKGERFKEPLLNSISDIVNDLYDQIKNKLDKSPYALFGYSMGSLVSFELYRKIKKNGHKLPIHFFASSFEAPQYIFRKLHTYNLPDPEFKKEVLKYNGFPKEFMNDESFLDYYLRILRSDFQAIETYKYKPSDGLLESNTTVFFGENDKTATYYKLEGWRYLTDKKFQIYRFSGDHFFIDDFLSEVVTIVNNTLYPY
ncbi:thioesterase II family protein [Niallia taxi]|uniref:thioesterase II family protein n=1 Tax=Niallia taxi TaxID=2499688 RepID=UPI0029345366|nr:thioesterase domain-containing protein [Niallia taxi]WOD65176.1 thioesterase domain-containing protein [Niallia taxi]